VSLQICGIGLHRILGTIHGLNSHRRFSSWISCTTLTRRQDLLPSVEKECGESHLGF
jgi:hypothetical protein